MSINTIEEEIRVTIRKIPSTNRHVYQQKLHNILTDDILNLAEQNCLLENLLEEIKEILDGVLIERMEHPIQVQPVQPTPVSQPNAKERRKKILNAEIDKIDEDTNKMWNRQLQIVESSSRRSYDPEWQRLDNERFALFRRRSELIAELRTLSAK